MYLDSISLERLNKLHPICREKAIDGFKLINADSTLDKFFRVSQGLRTMDQQAAIPTSNTNATGDKVMLSYHLYGLAFDLVIIDRSIEGHVNYIDSDPTIEMIRTVVQPIFVSEGFYWGGNFKSIIDYPHFEYHIQGLGINGIYQQWKAQNKPNYIDFNNIIVHG